MIAIFVAHFTIGSNLKGDPTRRTPPPRDRIMHLSYIDNASQLL